MQSLKTYNMETSPHITFIVNSLRIIVGSFLLMACCSDIYGIFADPVTYEHVYTGEFLGERRYDSLLQLKIYLWIQALLFALYVMFVILHLTKLRNSKVLAWTLSVADVVILIHIGYSLYGVFFLYS